MISFLKNYYLIKLPSFTFFWLFIFIQIRLAVVYVKSTLLALFASESPLKLAAGGNFGIFSPADANSGRTIPED